jgi:hypothetical protein
VPRKCGMAIKIKCELTSANVNNAWSLTSTHPMKVKTSLCLTKHHAKKTYRRLEIQLHVFLTTALDGGDW